MSYATELDRYNIHPEDWKGAPPHQIARKPTGFFQSLPPAQQLAIATRIAAKRQPTNWSTHHHRGLLGWFCQIVDSLPAAPNEPSNLTMFHQMVFSIFAQVLNQGLFADLPASVVAKIHSSFDYTLDVCSGGALLKGKGLRRTYFVPPSTRDPHRTWLTRVHPKAMLQHIQELEEEQIAAPGMPLANRFLMPKDKAEFDYIRKELTKLLVKQQLPVSRNKA